MESLSFLDFEGCRLLTELPSLSGLPNLGGLCLDNCTNLTRIHKSIGFLDRLVLLSTQGCTKLQLLVPSMNLPSLETLDLRGCLHLKSFPEVLGVMENIKDIYLDQTCIDELPFSISSLVGLQRLFLRECPRLIQLPNSIRSLPKLEIIMAHNSRGFHLFEDKEENVGTEVVFPKAMLVYKDGCDIFVDVCSLNTCPNNVIQVCRPSHVADDFGFMLKEILGGTVNWYAQGSNESSVGVGFWFRNKFPTLALCCAGESPTYEGNTVLDFKLSVLINGTKQFSFSSNYICSAEGKKDQLILCDLECKEAERSFREHEWNHVEILCELKYPMQCGSERVMAATHNKTAMRIPSQTLVYDYGGNKEDVKFLPLATECQKVVKYLQRVDFDHRGGLPLWGAMQLDS